MRTRVTALALILLSCASDEPGDGDPLDLDLIRELSMAQGDASGSEHAGLWTLSFEQEACDCPSVELDGEPVDLCELGALSVSDATEIEFTEGSGILAIPTGPDAPFGVMTGAVELNGDFDVAAHHDASTLVGPLETLTRLDGKFSASGNQVSGWAGQRLIGELLGENIDCRQTGSFTGWR